MKTQGGNDLPKLCVESPGGSRQSWLSLVRAVPLNDCHQHFNHFLVKHRLKNASRGDLTNGSLRFNVGEELNELVNVNVAVFFPDNPCPWDSINNWHLFDIMDVLIMRRQNNE